ncbi:MAG: hypothetical protein ACREB3_07265, partial [Burkholderiales bacterium]
LQGRGYSVLFFFLWVPSVDLALSRIRGRVLEGGHDVPEPIVRRRFNRSIRNFLTRYRRLGDSWTLFDNSSETPTEIACEEVGKLRIMESGLYSALLERYQAQ